MPSLNSWGFLALIPYIATLIPTNLVAVFPQTKKCKLNKFLCHKRRILGLLAFFTGTIHAALAILQYDIDLMDLKTYSIYYTGISSFTILFLLAITSNKWSVKKLRRNWKRLHYLTYLAMFLILWHILSLMQDSWTFYTYLEFYCLSIITIIFIMRLGVECNRQGQKSLRGKLK